MLYPNLAKSNKAIYSSWWYAHPLYLGLSKGFLRGKATPSPPFLLSVCPFFLRLFSRNLLPCLLNRLFKPAFAVDSN